MTQLQYYNWMIVTMEKLAINTTAASTEAVRVQNVVVLITPIHFAIPTKRQNLTWSQSTSGPATTSACSSKSQALAE